MDTVGYHRRRDLSRWSFGGCRRTKAYDPLVLLTQEKMDFVDWIADSSPILLVPAHGVPEYESLQVIRNSVPPARILIVDPDDGNPSGVVCLQEAVQIPLIFCCIPLMNDCQCAATVVVRCCRS